jgi:hypothetical protein
MPFANAKDRRAVGRDPAVRIPQSARRRRLGCDRARSAAWILPIQTLVFEVRKENHVVVYEVRTPAVFVRARSRVEAGRDCIGRPAIRRATDNGDAARFVRTALQPVNHAIGKLKLAEAYAGRG